MLSRQIKAQEAGEPAQSTVAAAEPTRAPLNLLNNGAFPCLRCAKGEVVAAPPDTADGGFAVPDVASLSLAGTSARIGSVPADKVDYLLNPSKRRGGEEVLSSSYIGLSSLPKTTSLSQQHSLINSEVIGSLPKGLTPQKRLSIAQSTPKSPAFNSYMNSVGRERPGEPQRSHLDGSVVVFITAGYSGKHFIFERCKELNVRAFIIDGPDSWSQGLVGEGLVAQFVPLDFADADTLFDRLVDACQEIRRKEGYIDGILTFCELAVPLVSRVAERLGLPGNKPDAVDTARNKHRARACMKDAGLPSPLNYLIKSAEQLEAAAAHVGFPAVIKPISGAASIGVIRVNNEEELKTSFARVMKDLKGAKVVAGALVEGDGGDEADANGNAAAWMDLSIMMEEYLDGPEVDVDLVFSKGEATYGAITDNWPTVEPYFNETGSNCPSLLPRAQQMELMQLAVQAVQCMGFEAGVFHVELKYTSRGARLIEVNARMGGGPVRDTNKLVWGVDLVEQQLLAACGIAPDTRVAQKPIMQLAELTINAAVTGVLQNTEFIERYQGKEGVLYARPLVEPGASCVCVKDGLPTWIAEIMVSRAPVEKAVEFIKQMEEEMTPDIPITPSSA